jgi:hypothetical protein
MSEVHTWLGAAGGKSRLCRFLATGKPCLNLDSSVDLFSALGMPRGRRHRAYVTVHPAGATATRPSEESRFNSAGYTPLDNSIVFLSNLTSLPRHPWKKKFRGKLGQIDVVRFTSHCGAI